MEKIFLSHRTKRFDKSDQEALYDLQDDEEQKEDAAQSVEDGRGWMTFLHYAL